MTDSRTREDQVEDEPDTASEGMQKKKKKKRQGLIKNTQDVNLKVLPMATSKTTWVSKYSNGL